MKILFDRSNSDYKAVLIFDLVEIGKIYRMNVIRDKESKN